MNKDAQNFRRPERGNALLFILVAVVLLGLLTMLLSRSGSSVDQSGDFEQLRIKATQIMRYTSGIEQAIVKLKTINGCSENEISFQNSDDTNYDNTRSPDDNSCHVFEMAGGGLQYRSLTDKNLTALGGKNLGFSGDVMVMGVERDTSISGNELIAFIGVSQNLCEHINTQQGISNATADITSNITTLTKYVGTFTDDFQLGDGAGEAPALADDPIGCFIDDNDEYVFYQVLIAR